jgi:hypothetical protein
MTSPTTWAAILVAASATVLSAQSTRSAVLPRARVSLRIDSTHTAQFNATGFELRVADDAQVTLTRGVDAATPQLVAIAAARAVVPSVVVEVNDSLAAPVMVLRLAGVTIASERVTLSNVRAQLEQQRIAQQEALSALTSDYQEAERQLATAEELGKTRVNTRQELARARDRAQDLKQRLELLRQRQALVNLQLESTGPLDETIVLRFQHLEIESRDGTGRAAVDFAPKQPVGHRR